MEGTDMSRDTTVDHTLGEGARMGVFQKKRRF
jgi:hypothetical protein